MSFVLHTLLVLFRRFRRSCSSHSMFTGFHAFGKSGQACSRSFDTAFDASYLKSAKVLFGEEYALE